jgi:glycosyltransferase involved in cell wall biosynthesis
MMIDDVRAPTFSALINNHNYGTFLVDAVRSALTQRLPPDEVIVVDDGSTDDSVARCRAAFADESRVRILTQPNAGQLAAFITATAEARGDVLAFLDADDAWEPEYLARLAALYQARPDVDFVFTNMRYFGARQGLRYRWPHDHDHGHSLLLAAWFQPWLASATSAISLRRPLAQRVLDLPDDLVRQWKTHGDDFLAYGADLLGAHKYRIAAPLVRYRAHADNAWLDRRRDAQRRYLHGVGSERMLQHYRARAGIKPGWARLAKLELRTKPQPRWSELKAYWALLRFAPLGARKRLEHRFAMLGYFLTRRFGPAARS